MNPQATQKIEVVAGETLLWRITASVNNQPMNLTGYSYRGRVRTTTGVVLADMAFDTSVLAQGVVTAVIDRLVSATIPAGLHQYDVFALSPDGVDTVVGRGTYRVLPRMSA